MDNADAVVGEVEEGAKPKGIQGYFDKCVK